MKEFLHYVLGNIEWPLFAALYFFSMIGVIINLLIHANKRDQASKNTPQKFSFGFLARDNRTRLIIDVLLMFVTVRFLPGVMNFDPSDIEFYLGGAFFVGLSVDKLLEMWKGSKYGSFLQESRTVQEVAPAPPGEILNDEEKG